MPTEKSQHVSETSLAKRAKIQELSDAASVQSVKIHERSARLLERSTKFKALHASQKAAGTFMRGQPAKRRGLTIGASVSLTKVRSAASAAVANANHSAPHEDVPVGSIGVVKGFRGGCAEVEFVDKKAKTTVTMFVRHIDLQIEDSKKKAIDDSEGKP